MFHNGSVYRVAILRTTVFLLVLAQGACAELQRKPEFGPLQNQKAKPLPLAQQPVRVAVRVIQGRAEARLSEGLLCSSGLPPYQKVSYELSTSDNVWRWTGFIGAGVVAGLVGTGMALGREPARGVVILGAYGIPLAGLGVYETMREKDVTEPTGAKAAQTPICPPGFNQMEVRVRSPKAGEAPVKLTTSWKAVSLPESGITQDGVLIPILQDETGLSAYVPPVKVKGLPPGPLSHAVVYSPPAAEPESTVLSAESKTPETPDGKPLKPTPKR